MRSLFACLIPLVICVSCKAKTTVDLVPEKPQSTKQYGAMRRVTEQDFKLQEAVRAMDAAQVQAALKAGATPQNDSYPFMGADYSASNIKEILTLLLDAGGNPNQTDDQGWTPLSVAISFGGKVSTDTLKFLMDKGSDMNFGGPGGLSPLHIAVRFHSLVATQLLIEKGAKVRVLGRRDPKAGKVGVIPILEGVFESDHVFNQGMPIHEVDGSTRKPIVEVLLKGGALVMDVDPNGWTPLHYAAMHANLEVIQALIAHGADVNAGSVSGRTPLHLATCAGFGFPNAPAIELLLKSGANPKAKDRDGLTPAAFLRARIEKLMAKAHEDPALLNGMDPAPFISAAEKTLKVLDPDGPGITMPKPVETNGDRKLKPISGMNYSIDRSVVRKAEWTELNLTLKSGASEPAMIEEIQMDNYEPLDLQKVELRPDRATIIRFPKEAGTQGGLMLNCKLKNGSLSINETGGAPTMMRDFSGSPANIKSLGGSGFRHEAKGRILEVKIDRLTIKNKEVAALSGKVLECVAIEPCVIPGMGKVGLEDLNVTFSYRYKPNKKWFTERY